MVTGFAYKVLGPGREAWHGGSGRWLPPGEWMPLIEDVEPCRSGYHLCADEDQLLGWLGPTIWVAEYDGPVIDKGDKVVVGRARLVRRVEGWDERTARHFAADCAERVAHLNPDPRVAEAIRAARRFADGEISREEAADAAAAAWAAKDAAKDAAWDAATAAWAAATTTLTPWASAKEAAGAAAWDAARAWQGERLREITGGLPREVA
jgi:hypothetical protein